MDNPPRRRIYGCCLLETEGQSHTEKSNSFGFSSQYLLSAGLAFFREIRGNNALVYLSTGHVKQNIKQN
jgi:hypothetical protein